jgi:ParB-like chromosome segregation protein Spo0J
MEDVDDEAPPSEEREGEDDALSLDSLDEDTTFRMRDEGELSPLATDIARLGQLFPIDVRPSEDGRYQVICGFRRVAALKFLQREKIQARIHQGLSDEDALLMSLASAIHAQPMGQEALAELREQLDQAGRLFPAAQDMLDRALLTEDPLAPETVNEDGSPVPAAEEEEAEEGDEEGEEVDADELADDVTARLGEINQDLALLADVFASLDEAKRQELLTQLRYSSELVTFLEEK